MPSSTQNPAAANDVAASEIAAAGRSIAQGALLLAPGEHVVIVADAPGAAIGLAIANAAGEIGAHATFLRLESLGARPLTDLHPTVRSALGRAQASVLIAGFEPGEFEMRSEFVSEAARLKLRHAHMVGVTQRSVVMGSKVDPRQIEVLAAAVRSRLRADAVMRVRSAHGTDLTVRCSPQMRWIEHTGVVRAGMKENLPAGELVTCPGDVHGVYVADGSLGDGNGVLRATLGLVPVRLFIEGGVVCRFECDDPVLLERLERAVGGVAYLDRVGLIGFGINTGMTGLAGDIFTDQKLPGFHISLGMTFPQLTGATWSAANWIAFTAVGSDIEIDGEEIMRAGRYLI
jgi:aminopeptidase